jgi:hypothetical protein
VLDHTVGPLAAMGGSKTKIFSRTMANAYARTVDCQSSALPLAAENPPPARRLKHLTPSPSRDANRRINHLTNGAHP